MAKNFFNRYVWLIDSLPLHPSRKETETTKEYSVFRYCLVPTFDFKQENLNHGQSVEVLSPESLRNGIHAEIKTMLQRYD
jgi:predicted DNA-binding transcriptional regulator YafY